MASTIGNIARESWLVLGEMAPYLLVGFLAAGVLSVFVSPAWVERRLGRPGLGPVFTASLLGVPLPLCSCGVIPVSASLRRHGASRSATTAFLLSTPQTGVDSIAVTYALLGPAFALFRPIAALLTGMLGGMLVQLFGEGSERDREGASERTRCAEGCCAGEQEPSAWVRALHYGFVTLPRDIGLALGLGVLIAGAMAVFVPPGHLHAYVGGGLLSILALMAVGVPVYVCATASVPIAAGFVQMGASPGAALAFLIAGPATNAATLTTVWKVLGQRTAILYLMSVAASAIGCGLILDRLIPTVELALPQLSEHVHTPGDTTGLTHLATATLLVVLALSYLSKTGHKSQPNRGATSDSDARRGEQQLVLAVEGMTCSHCAASVTRVLSECRGVSSADVDLKRKRVVITGDRLDSNQLAASVMKLGYSSTIIGDAKSIL